MSFILDALKKSEAERQRQAGPALIEMRIMRPTRRLPTWAIIAGTLLCVGVVALAWVALRKPSSSGAATPAAAAAPAAPAAAPPVAAPAASAPAATSAGGVVVATVPPASPSIAQAPATTTAQAPAATDDNPADEAPAEPPPAGSGSAHVDMRGLRNYAELGGNMPELRLDLHVYAAKPAERYAFINMHKVREGDTTAEGVLVKTITPEGVVLEYRGTEFLLGR